MRLRLKPPPWTGSPPCWTTAHGPDIAPETTGAERADYGQMILERRLQDTRARLNQALPNSALDDAFRRVIRLEEATQEAK